MIHKLRVILVTEFFYSLNNVFGSSSFLASLVVFSFYFGFIFSFFVFFLFHCLFVFCFFVFCFIVAFRVFPFLFVSFGFCLLFYFFIEICLSVRECVCVCACHILPDSSNLYSRIRNLLVESTQRITELIRKTKKERMLLKIMFFSRILNYD